MRTLIAGVVFVCVLLLPRLLIAQSELTLDEIDRLIAQSEELRAWNKAYEKWERWTDKWGARTKYFNGQKITERPLRPAPPEWLENDCQHLIRTDNADLARGCELLQHDEDRYNPGLVRARKLIQAKEHQDKGSFWDTVHFDGPYTSTRLNAEIFGLVGMHKSFKLPGFQRVEVYGPPGIMLVATPRAGGLAVKPGFTWGLDFRVGEFSTPVTHKRFYLYMSVTKCWVDFLIDGQNGGYDMIGFSITRK